LSFLGFKAGRGGVGRREGLENVDVHGAAFGGFVPDGRVGDEVRREVSFGVDAAPSSR